ncbi:MULTISPECIES: hypothetical protein [unclassified Bartonella]
MTIKRKALNRKDPIFHSFLPNNSETGKEAEKAMGSINKRHFTILEG